MSMRVERSSLEQVRGYKYFYSTVLQGKFDKRVNEKEAEEALLVEGGNTPANKHVGGDFACEEETT